MNAEQAITFLREYASAERFESHNAESEVLAVIHSKHACAFDAVANLIESMNNQILETNERD